MRHPGSDLATQIEALMVQRRELETAIDAIDKTLAKVGAALGGNGITPTSVAAATSAIPAAPKRRRRRRKFAVPAEAAVLAIIGKHKNPTTQEINKLWKKEGRGFTADNTLTKLVKEKKLKREPLKDRRGSRYLLA